MIPGLRAAVVDDSVMDVEDVEEAEFEEPVVEPLDGEDSGEDYDLDEDDLEPDEEEAW